MASRNTNGRLEASSLNQNPAAVEAVIAMGFYTEEEALSTYHDLQRDGADSSSRYVRDDVTSGTSNVAGEVGEFISQSLMLALDAKSDSRLNNAPSTCGQSFHNQQSSLEQSSLSELGAANATSTAETQVNQKTLTKVPTAQPVQISSGNEEVPSVSSSSTAASDEGLNSVEISPVAYSHPTEPTRAELKERLRVLRKENRRLKERQTCRKCHERPVSLTFLPCGHFSFCKECGLSFTACPLCRRTILADVCTIAS